jgi:AbrB family looped-hinge helix DNA binding protein
MGWHTMTETVVLGESGRIVLPAAIRKKFGLKPGDLLTVSDSDDSIQIMSRRMALKSIQSGIIKHRGSLSGVLDEFLAERRQAAEREAEELAHG